MTYVNLAGCRKQVEPTKPLKKPISVNVIKLSRVEETVETAAYFGELEPNRSRTLGFTVAGMIESVANVGETVAVGKELANLDVNVFSEQKKSIQARLSQTQDQEEFERLQQELEQIDEQIQARRISAPFRCVVDEVFAFENSLLRAQSPVVRVVDLENPKIKINLPSKIARFIRDDLEVYFILENETLIGSVAQKSQMENAGSVVCWFDIKTDMSNVDFSFGQTVEARFNFQTGNSGFWVPLSSLDRSGEGIWTVFLVETTDGESTISRQIVTVVQVADDQALIDGDNLEGAVAVADGIHRVVPGQAVETRLVPTDETVVSEESVE